MQRRLRVTGIVQGVGFRPYVWHLARSLMLAGWVRNDPGGVEVVVEGEPEEIGAFTRRLALEIPPLARVDGLTWADSPASGVLSDFCITESGAGQAATMIGHDSAVCPDCLAEMFDPADRRWRYAFINCTHCGPRYTLTRSLPYDRARTSMAAFPLCPDCEGEYRDPANRRFHAEPTACPVCGPKLSLRLCSGAISANFATPAHFSLLFKGRVGEGMGVRRSATSEPIPLLASPLKGEGLGKIALIPAGGREQDPIADTLQRLQSGQIVALKGLGGFHLACDARNAPAVQSLRERKHRDEKPFAIMAANLASIADWVEISAAEAELLQAPERPIVLLRKKPAADTIFPGIAPGLAWLGVMLPYTPLHWLLWHQAAGQPAGTDWMAQPQDMLLVMTSANPGGEPLVIGNDEAVERLAGIADAVLLHDRDIVVRCDDSVVRMTESNAPQFIRRARGYTPRAIRLPRAGPPVLALGGYLKNTICVTHGDEAFVSQHIGGLDNPATCGMLMEVTAHLLDILQVQPEAIAHDLHPDFFSTRHALELADKWGVPAVAVQHHHAHIAAVVAEHGVTGPVLGLAMDGIGLGDDSTAWGGELLRVEAAGFTRLGHLAPISLPGADKAAKEPWRMAAAALFQMGRGKEIARRFPHQPAAAQLHQLLERGLNTPQTSSLGRWFDAAAGLLGAREVMAYEGQAAMLLEGLAEGYGRFEAMPNVNSVRPELVVRQAHHDRRTPSVRAEPVVRQAHHDRRAPSVRPELVEGHFRFDKGFDRLSPNGDAQLDLLPLLSNLADEKDAAKGAALFHATLASALADWTERAALEQGLTTVALGGGCFLNHILSRALKQQLGARGFTVLEARQVPPNDGGLSLGQAWVAMQKLSQG